MDKQLDMDEVFFKTICEKYIATMSKELLLEIDNEIVHIFIEDDYIELKEKGQINKDNYKQYFDENFSEYKYKTYQDLYESVIKDEIIYDINDLGLINEDKEWDFYISFGELKKMGYGYEVKKYYPIIEQHGVSEKNIEDFFSHFTLEQLDDFEHSLYLYWIAHDIIADEDMSLVSKENYIFNSDIIRLSCGLISYEDFIKEYQDIEPFKHEKILPIVIKYFKEKEIETLKEYGNDGDEGLYHLSDLYKELMNQLNIKFDNIYTEDKEPGEYTTYIEFDNNNRIGIYTKSSNDMETVINNLAFISSEFDNFVQKQNEFDYDY